MHEQQKHDTMEAFRNGELAVLVATTVVEVGVDVTNAAGMVVLGAERFGLATLHQLRGRVGRGARQGYTFFVYTSPLAATGAARLRALKETGDGFEIAERDLTLRGPGELLGLRQAGMPELRVAELGRDLALARQARRDARSALAAPGTPQAAGAGE
jgi:ATP-dependent DNA helicase RecG